MYACGYFPCFLHPKGSATFFYYPKSRPDSLDVKTETILEKFDCRQ